MAQNPITNEEIRDKFLITLMYGTHGEDWPNETVAACKIICTVADDNESIYYQVFRNGVNKHAEENLIEYLRWDAAALQARKIKIEVYINYSPCSSCAETILDYIKAMKLLKREITMTIVFANFYKIFPNSTSDNANIKGLKGLYNQPVVELQLLGAHVAWATFLDMSEFFSFADGQKTACLNEAGLDPRKAREEMDKKFWEDKKIAAGSGVQGITSGMQNLMSPNDN